jgi:crotonobetainyl-CoA:carnitine CoA-transferase CaiB-like acyl-CoA transferase
VWGAVDVTGGWLAACGVLAGLYARRRTGDGQSVRSSLLGAALTLESGSFLAGDRVVRGPVLDADQRGYGATYRLYEGGDGAWFALAVPDAPAWTRLCALVGVDGLPEWPPPLRTDGAPQPAERLLEHAFAAKDAETWVAALRAADLPAERVAETSRRDFADAFLDDPVNRQLGRVVAYPWGDRGVLEQPAFPVRFGPAPRPSAIARIPRLGEHTHVLLESLGFDAEARAALAAAGAVPGEEGRPGS